MKCRYDKMSGLSKSKNRRYRLLISHLSYDEDIWIFTHRITYCLIKSRNMSSYLFLMDETFIIFYDVFDRIFDRDDMFMVIFIEIIYHRHKCGRLTASCTTSDKDESLIFMKEFEKILLQSDTISCRKIFFYGTKGNTYSFLIFRYIGSKSRPIIFINKIISCSDRLDIFSCKLRIHENDNLHNIIHSKFSKTCYGFDISVGHANIWKITASYMEIGNTVLHDFIDELEIFLDEGTIGHKIQNGDSIEYTLFIS